MKLLRTNFRPFNTIADAVEAYPVISSIEATGAYAGGGSNEQPGSITSGGMATFGAGAYGATEDRNIVSGGIYGVSYQGSLGSWVKVKLNTPISNGIALSYASTYHTGSRPYISGSSRICTDPIIGWDHAIIKIHSASLDASILFRFTPSGPSQPNPYGRYTGHPKDTGPDKMELSVIFLSGGSEQTIHTSGLLDALNFKTKLAQVSQTTANCYGGELGHTGNEIDTAYPISFKFNNTGNTAEYDFFVYHERIVGTLLRGLNSPTDSDILSVITAEDASFIIASIPHTQLSSGQSGFIGGADAKGTNTISNLAVNDLQGNTDNDVPAFMLMYQTNTSTTRYTVDGIIENPENITDWNQHTKTTFIGDSILYIDIDNTNVITLTAHGCGGATIPSDGTVPIDGISVTLNGVIKQPYDIGKSIHVCIVNKFEAELTHYQVITPTVYPTNYTLTFDTKNAIGQSLDPFTINDINSNMQLKIVTV